jgi:peptide/nickel transport system substrate-binding protein
MLRKRLFLAFSLLMIVSMVLAACQTKEKIVTQIVTQVVEKPGEVVVQTVEKPGEEVVVTKEVEKVVTKEVEVIVTQIVEVTPTAAPNTRKGAWVDTVVFTSIDNADQAIAQIQAGDIDVYAYTVADPLSFKTVKEDAKLSYSTSYGSYNELTFNPHGPTFTDGRLNPFSVAKIREAMNMLVDRNYIVQEIFGGLAVPKLTSLNSAFPDYARYVDVARELENKYAYNPEKAKEIIDAEMTTLGATLGADGKWQFNGAPVVIIAIIRTEDKRKDIGDYVSTQLETIGFTVDRQYKTRSEASPIWNQSDPAEGKMHFYTGGWITTAISRDDATNFGYFYTPLGSASPLWQAYVNTPEYKDVADKLWVNDFKSMDERAEMFKTALRLSMEDSVRVWIVDQISFAPQNANVAVAYDLAGGIAGSSLWPYTIQMKGEEGGTLRIAQPGILVEPWNPIAGSNWIYDAMPQRATGDVGVLADPYTGLFWPQRIEKMDVVVKEGLPVAKTLDWVTLSTAASIEVPADAWSDWDAVNQKFITAGEKFTSTQTANTKVTVYYPKDLWTTVKWHDGSPLTAADFVMRMIIRFDPGMAGSPIYDEAQVPTLDAFLSHFKGVKIVSTDPLVIETYDDQFYLDAEWSATTWFPYYDYGEAPWHTIALGYLADSKGELAFSTDKAGTKEIEWMSFIAGPSLAILKADLEEATTSAFIPYAATLGQFVTADEAAARYGNLKKWYSEQGHFWVGTGPFYLDKAFPVEKTLTLRRNADFADLATKWQRFGTPMIPVTEVSGPNQVKAGEEATFDVNVTFEGNPYANADIAGVKYLLFDATGALVASGDATAVEDGHFTVTLSKDVTTKLQAGSNKLEVIVSSSVVSIPGIVDYEFVSTAP